MRAATVFVLSAGVALPAVVAAPTAYAATVSHTATLDDGRLTVGLPGNALWVKVSVLASTAPDTAVLVSTDELTSTGYNAWTTDAPLQLPEGTALGTYPVAVEYRMPHGVVERWTGGTFGYKLHTGVSSAAFDRGTTSFDRRGVVLSGTATTWNPATGERTPAAEGTSVKVTLNLRDAYSAVRSTTALATTGADGAFALPVTPDAEITGGSAVVHSTAADVDPDDARPLPTVGVEKLTYRITSDTDRYRVHAGTDVKVTGRVERLTEEGWQPFAGAPVVSTGSEPLSYDTALRNQIGSGTTLADGSFTFAARPAYSTTGVYTGLRPSVYYGKGNDRPYDVAGIAVPQQFSYADARMTLDEYGKLTATGRLHTTASVTCYDKPDWVALQASLDNGRTWRNMASQATQYCSSYSFEVWGHTNALYRIYHPETDRFVTKTSTPVRLGRTPTRIVNVTITPSRPRVNGTMTVKGLVQQKVNGVWKAMPGARLTLLAKPKGDPTWYWAKKDVPTNSYGNFGFSTVNYGDATWILVLQSKNGYFYSESRTIYVDAL
ncbi:hypothetical protein [Streptomyces sp. NPDC093600]|uniref:hypothetical protein n=1 Tax=Streptomyces sp. NPDC093600 TaxID=3366047 RepID=UPI00381369FB